MTQHPLVTAAIASLDPHDLITRSVVRGKIVELHLVTGEILIYDPDAIQANISSCSSCKPFDSVDKERSQTINEHFPKNRSDRTGKAQRNLKVTRMEQTPIPSSEEK